VLTAEGLLKQKSFQLLPKWVDGWCYVYEIVRQCFPALNGGNWKSTAYPQLAMRLTVYSWRMLVGSGGSRNFEVGAECNVSAL